MELGNAKIKESESIEKAQQRKAEKLKDKGPKGYIITIMRIIGWLTVIIGIVYGTQGRLFSEVYIFLGVVCGILVVGVAEALDLLQRLYINTRK